MDDRKAYAREELRLAWAELCDGISSPGIVDALMGVLHVQARMFHALEAAGVLPEDLAVELLAQDIEAHDVLPGAPLALTIERAMHALLIVTEVDIPPEGLAPDEDEQS